MWWLRSKLSSIHKAKWSPKLFETNFNLDLHNKESFLWENGVTHWPQSLVNSTYNHKTLCSWFSLPPAYLPTFNARLVEIERGLAGRTTTAWLINIRHFCFISKHEYGLELVSKELNHFGVIAGLFWQIRGHSSRFMLFCSFWRLFTIKMIKSISLFFLKNNNIFFLYFIKIKLPA